MNSPEFPAPSPNNSGFLTVSALNTAIAKLLEGELGILRVRGEVSGLKRAASGHLYFQLKEGGAAIDCVMYKFKAQLFDRAPREGEQIELKARVTMYEPRGALQLRVESWQALGQGDLFEAFLQLKAKLQAMGWFDAENKQALPTFPRTVGIITSPQAAALQDVLTALRRRCPHIKLVLYPSLVQGESAAPQLAKQIETANERAEVEVLLLVRGGGNLEDLNAFNQEILAAAIFESTLPIICGVGHETDFSIADFVADLRAPTPTAAAELVAPSRADWLAQLAALRQSLDNAAQSSLAKVAQRLDYASQRLLNPSKQLALLRDKLAKLKTDLAQSASNEIRYKTAQYKQIKLAKPDLSAYAADLSRMTAQIKHAQQQSLKHRAQRLAAAAAQLASLSPQATLARGFALITDDKNQLLASAAAVQNAGDVNIQWADGEKRARLVK